MLQNLSSVADVIGAYRVKQKPKNFLGPLMVMAINIALMFNAE